MKTYIKYTKEQVKEIKQALNDGEQINPLAERLSNEWNIPFNSIYQKVRRVSKTKRKYAKRAPKPVAEATITLNNECVELTGAMRERFVENFKSPSKVVLYSDHIRYYFN
jgi:predicted patatin/cPLA2 family phospholipase